MYRYYSLSCKKLFLALFSSLAPPYISYRIVGSNFKIYFFLKLSPVFPSAAVFPAVITVLSLISGISFYLVLKSDKPKGSAVYIYCLSHFIAFMWPILFFVMQAYSFALIWAVILWLSAFACVMIYSKINKAAAMLQIPLLLWLSFSVYLNYLVSAA